MNLEENKYMILSNRYHYPADFHDRAQAVLETALETAPLYQQWRAFDPGLGAGLDERYDALPELTKQDMRQNFPLGLVSNGLNVDDALARDEIEYTFTSGTTSEKVINLWYPKWWYGGEEASLKLNAHTARFTFPQKEAKLAISLNFGIHCEEDLSMEHRILGPVLYLNEKLNLICWQKRHMERMARELKEFQPVILEANPSLLARLAFWAIDAGVELYSPEVIIFTYELPSKIHLAAIRKVFSSPFVSSYGTTETGFVMEQCEAGMFHQNLDYCRIDFHPLKDRFGGPEIGRMLVTTFQNPWSTVLRFDVGDLIRLHPSGQCACGRHEGLIAQAILGRTANATFTTNGGLVTSAALDDQLALIPEIRDYHLEQQTPKKYDLQVMAGESPKARENIRDALAAFYGPDGEYEIRFLPNLLPGPAGKYRRTQANFDFDQRGLFQ